MPGDKEYVDAGSVLYNWNRIEVSPKMFIAVKTEATINNAVTFYRIFALFLAFTPSLGLLDILHHGRLGAMSPKTWREDTIFDFSEHGSPISFNDAWNPFKLQHVAEFFPLPIEIVFLLISAIFLLHIFVSTCLQKLTVEKVAERSFISIDGLVIQAVNSFLSPPLHLDWEFYYRLSGGHQSVGKCWRRYGY